MYLSGVVLGTILIAALGVGMWAAHRTTVKTKVTKAVPADSSPSKREIEKRHFVKILKGPTPYMERLVVCLAIRPARQVTLPNGKVLNISANNEPFTMLINDDTFDTLEAYEYDRFVADDKERIALGLTPWEYFQHNTKQSPLFKMPSPVPDLN